MLYDDHHYVLNSICNRCYSYVCKLHIHVDEISYKFNYLSKKTTYDALTQQILFAYFNLFARNIFFLSFLIKYD